MNKDEQKATKDFVERGWFSPESADELRQTAYLEGRQDGYNAALKTFEDMITNVNLKIEATRQEGYKKGYLKAIADEGN